MLEASMQVLKRVGKPLSAEEIYNHIIQDKLFVFGAKDPIAVLKSQLRSSSVGFAGKNPSKNPKLKMDDHKKFSLI